MGRSVSTPVDVQLVAYEDFAYDDLQDDIAYSVCDMWPSVEPDHGWLGREDRILASNRHAYFGLSEYCGLVAIWVAPRDPECPLAAKWIDQIAPRFHRRFGTLRKLGHFSNGEAVYERGEERI